jgi:restriction endonuclease S subunit
LWALRFEPTGQNSISATKIRCLKAPLSPLSEQLRFVAEIEQIDQTLFAAKAAALTRKQAAMQKYL